MNERTKAALIGGALAGILSAIPVVNYCCCLWAIGGGILAVFMYTKDTKAVMTPGDGAMLGAIAGGIGAAIYLVISLPLNLLLGAAAISAQLAQANVDLPFSGMALVIVGVLVGAILVLLFTVIGGLIGAPLFGKGRGAGCSSPASSAELRRAGRRLESRDRTGGARPSPHPRRVWGRTRRPRVPLCGGRTFGYNSCI